MGVESVEGVELTAQPAAVVRGLVTRAELPQFLGGAFEETLNAITGQGRAPAGPPFARYRVDGDDFAVEAGFPSTGAVGPTGRVTGGELVGGTAVRVLYRGPYERIAEAYEAGEKWLADRGCTPSGPPWESYLDEPDVAEPRTVVHLPFRS
jgi:effector-binding domain-containing protein